MKNGLNWILEPVQNNKSGDRDPKSLGACSSVWLERTPDKREVDGSTPSRPTTVGKGKRIFDDKALRPEDCVLTGV